MAHLEELGGGDPGAGDEAEDKEAGGHFPHHQGEAGLLERQARC